MLTLLLTPTEPAFRLSKGNNSAFYALTVKKQTRDPPKTVMMLFDRKSKVMFVQTK